MRRPLLIASLALAGCAASPAEGPVSAEPRSAEDAHVPLRAPVDDELWTPAGGSSRALPAARSGNPWMDCYRRFQPSDDPAADLSHLTTACAERAGFVAVTSIHIGSQGEADPSERLVFRAHRQRCYRAFAVGARSIIDLDVAVFDPQHNLVAADLSRDRWSVVPPRGPLCVPRSGAYTLEIAVAEGRGDYLFQIWGSREETEEDEPGGAE